jgi:hypothetical protein
MLPGFRFVLGAFLAVMLLAVAGLGLVISVQLVHEARTGPLQDSRSLAYAGQAEWNQFYDPEGARRFEGLARKTEAPLAEARLETPADDAALAPIAPSIPAEQTASIPAGRLEPDAAPVISYKTPETDPPHPDSPPLIAAPAVVTIAPAATIAAPPAESVTPAPEVPGQTESAPAAERVAGAPTAWPGADPHEPVPASTQPQAGGDPQPDATPPTPRARPKPHFHKKIVRAHFRRTAPANRQTVQNSGFSTSNAPWPGTDNQFTGATGKKSSSNLTTLSNRPQ